jgi:hypothetical protein
MNATTAAALQNCIPYHLSVNDLTCRWLDVQDKPFDDPFFDETINARRAFTSNAKRIRCISSLHMLPEWDNTVESIAPTAIIFHVSRCGSTLLSQLLSLDPRHIVLSEVPFFDELLRLQYKTPASDIAQHDKWLQSAVRFYGQKRNGEERHLFIKADCWHIFFYDRLRKLYPNTPIILLYRTPGEVLRSQQKRRGMQSVPGLVEPAVMGLEMGEEHPALTNLDLYFSLVLEKILEAFYQVAQKDNNCLLVNYKEGMMPVLHKIATHAGVELRPAILEQMQKRTRYHGKYPDQVFEEEPFTGLHEYLKNSQAWYEKLEVSRGERCEK